MRQVRSEIFYYKENTGVKIADDFLDSLEEALAFIAKNPYSCAV